MRNPHSQKNRRHKKKQRRYTMKKKGGEKIKFQPLTSDVIGKYTLQSWTDSAEKNNIYPILFDSDEIVLNYGYSDGFDYLLFTHDPTDFIGMMNRDYPHIILDRHDNNVKILDHTHVETVIDFYESYSTPIKIKVDDYFKNYEVFYFRKECWILIHISEWAYYYVVIHEMGLNYVIMQYDFDSPIEREDIEHFIEHNPNDYLLRSSRPETTTPSKIVVTEDGITITTLPSYCVIIEKDGEKSVLDTSTNISLTFSSKNIRVTTRKLIKNLFDSLYEYKLIERGEYLMCESELEDFDRDFISYLKPAKR